MQLTPQDKLALMITSAGSQRRLASLMGVSHQKIGRWLREGEKAVIDAYTGEIAHSAGAVKIPESAHAIIDNAFQHHKEVCRQQSKDDDLPYLKDTPVFIFRKALRDGNPGQRGFVLDTQYIKQKLRTQIFTSMQRTDKVLTANVRSTVDFIKYTGRVVDQERAGGFVLGSRKNHIKSSLLSFYNKNQIQPENYKQSLFTRGENFMPGTDTAKAVKSLENQLQSKHSPAATSFADEFLFHIIPQNYARPQSQTARRKAIKKPANKRGK